MVSGVSRGKQCTERQNTNFSPSWLVLGQVASVHLCEKDEGTRDESSPDTEPGAG